AQWGMGGGGRRQFMQQMSPQTQDAMRQIFHDQSLDRAAKHARMQQLIQKESPQVQAAFAEFQSHRGERRQQMQQKFAQLSSSLSPQARAAADRVRSIMMVRNVELS
ncbi:hypothetical protein PFISCL1PPCAC_13965, partial [Pristionchus fissidentatus]